jgi:hypothetical protein
MLGRKRLIGGPQVTLVVVCLLLLAVPAWAQIDRGQIAGFVKDQQGAVIPGATVTLVNTSTQVVRTLTTDGQGYYIGVSLLPGVYDVSVELQGFKKFTQTGVKVDATAKVALDVVLETGEISEVVTVEARTTPLQTDTAQVGRLIEAKQIQDLMLNGRNALRLPMLKAGVRSGNAFGGFSPTDFGNGGWNINGSRADENILTYDGVPALRTRSSGANIGLPDVDSIQEVQVLTSSFAAEFGRASGGQVRIVTKGGSRNFHGALYENYRSEGLDANTWARNASGDSVQMAGPPLIDFNQFGYNFSGPLMIPGVFNEGRDKAFFFWGQEWYVWNQQVNSTQRVPTEKMRQGDFSELLGPNIFYSAPRLIIDPLTGQPFSGNVIPQDRLSPNGMAFLNAFPLPTPGYSLSNNNWTFDDVQEPRQRKDTLRLDFLPSQQHQLTLRGSLYNWTQLDAFRGGFQFARTDWDRPNKSAALSWLWTISPGTINEMTLGYAKDTVKIPVYTGDGQYDRTRYGISYPYLFPGKEIENKVPTVQIGQLTNPIDGGPYPSSSAGPIYTFSNTLTHVRNRHTFKVGAYVEYSGEDDFDQINVQANLPGDTNNQNGRFEFNDGRAGGTGTALANTALGLFTNYAEIGERSYTEYRAWTIDLFAQDSWKAKDNLTFEYGIRWAIWQPWYARWNNMAQFDPRYFSAADAAVVHPTGGYIVSGDPYNGVVLPGDGWPDGARENVGIAASGEYDRLFRGLPRGFNETHWDTLEPRLGVAWSVNDRTVVRAGAGIFHNRFTLNDSTLLGGNAPVQIKQGVSNGLADNPAGASVQRVFPLVMTMQDLEFPHPTSYKASVSVQRELGYNMVVDVAYVGTYQKHQIRERNINQLQPGTVQANPGVNTNALRPYQGFGIIRLSENQGKSWYNGLQVELNRRFAGGLGFGIAYTFSKLISNADDKRNLLFNAFDDSGYKAISGNNRTHVLAVNYLYELPFWREQDTTLKKILGGWQLSGVTFISSGNWLSVWRGDDIAGVGETTAQPWDLVGDFEIDDQGFSLGVGKDDRYWFNKAAFAQPAPGTFGNAGRNIIEGPHQVSWDIALLKNFPIHKNHRIQVRLDVFNFPNHPNWNDPNVDPRNALFGRVTGKTGQRTMQIGLRYAF